MAQSERQKEERRDRKKGTPDRKRRGQTSEGVADWQQADAALVVAVIAAVALEGGAVRFGYTRDGGAYAVGIYGDGEPYTEYVRPTEDLDLYLRGIWEDFRRE